MAETPPFAPTQAADTAAGQRRMVWVNACEIDCLDGCLTIRAGDLQDEPLLIALPAHAAEALPDVLSSASLDAEEEYWDTMAAVVAEATEPELADAAAGSWILTQDWSTGLDDLIDSDEDIFLVVQFGFVGLVVGPPFARSPAFAIFDPLQLRRLDEAIRQSVADGITTAHPASSPAEIDRTLRALAARSWGAQAASGAEQPTAVEARAEMQRRKVEFLARTPRIGIR